MTPEAEGAAESAMRETQQRILRAATEIFAARGFKDTTTRAICAKAGVNVALVNYYFRSKAELYKAVIGALFEDVAHPMKAIPDSVRDEETWRTALRAWVRRSLAICAATQPPDSHIARLLGPGSQVPAEVMEDLRVKFVQPMRLCFARLLRMGLREDDPLQLALWHSTLAAQYAVYALAKPGWADRYCPAGLDREAWLDRVCDHICEGVFARLAFQRVVP